MSKQIRDKRESERAVEAEPVEVCSYLSQFGSNLSQRSNEWREFSDRTRPHIPFQKWFHIETWSLDQVLLCPSL